MTRQSLRHLGLGRPIAATTAVARRISDGDLSSSIVVKGRDEATELLKAMQSMQVSLTEFQESLRESEQRTRLLLDSAGEGRPKPHCRAPTRPWRKSVHCSPGG